MRQLPKEWANQRPRNMAHAPQKPAPLPGDRFERPVKIFVGFAVALVLCSILAVLLFGLSHLADRRQTAVVAAVEVSITPTHVASSTPELTVTSEPPSTVLDHRQQKPTIKYTELSPVVETVTIIETVIVQVPAITEIVIERVITATGAPTATADAMQILREAQAKKAAADIAIQIRKDDARMKRAEFFGSPAFIVTAAVCVALLFGVLFAIKWNNGKPTLKDTTETVEEIEQDHNLTRGDMRDLIRASIALYGPDGKRIAGWRDVNGWTGERWDSTIQSLRMLGIGIYTQSGEGTYLTRYDLRTVLALLAPPYPSVAPNKNAVQNSAEQG